MLVANAVVEKLVVETITTSHTGCVAMAEDVIFQKLKLTSMTLAVDDVVEDDVVHRMALDLEEDRIDS